MRVFPGAALLGAVVGLVGGVALAAAAECATDAGGTRCVYRSLLPSSGLVSVCRDDTDCRVGHYYGDPAQPVWLTPPPTLAKLPRPEVVWLSATLAQVRFDCGPPCSVSYFFEARRRRLSEPRWFVLAVDTRRWLVALAEDRVLVIRQLFSGRPVTRIARDWAPGRWLGDAITTIHFDVDARLTLAWQRGPERAPVTERLSIPSFAAP
jgi:hypothetical protein